MLEKINDPIEVAVHFKADKVLPTAFRWQNRVYQIEKLNMVHKERAGNDVIYYFSVSDNANFFRLAFFTKDLSWRIEEIFN
jgi:hypothetical protein